MHRVFQTFIEQLTDSADPTTLGNAMAGAARALDLSFAYLRKRVRRGQVLAFFTSLPCCLVGIEACATYAKSEHDSEPAAALAIFW
jgi:hypothetical protein